MRMLNQESNQVVKKMILLLTIDEANELKDDLERLINNHQSNEHVHINDLQYTHELTVAIYDETSLDGFNERLKELILSDK